MPPRKRTPKKVADTATPIRGVEAPDRFLSGLSALEGVEIIAGLEGIQDLVGINVEIIRPEDLVWLSVRALNCDLVKQGRTPYLEAGADALLVVTHAYQHAHEEAQYEQVSPQANKDGLQEQPPDTGEEVAVTVPTPGAGVGYRPARRSRVVFEIPEGERIEFSSEGILAAMTRLTMRVHRLATPGELLDRGVAPTTKKLVLPPPPIGLPPVIHLGDGLVLQNLGEELVITSPPKAFFKENPPPDTSTAAGAAYAAREIQRARVLMSVQTPRVAPRTKFPEIGEFVPGGPWVPEIEGPIRHYSGKSEPPSYNQTAIEAPFRLVISPHSGARWAHATEPVRNPGAPGHVELWHSRLAGPPRSKRQLPPGLGGRDLDSPGRGLARDDEPAPGPNNETDRRARQLRAIWARDRDTVPNWQQPEEAGQLIPGLEHAEDKPFLGSLSPLDRHMIVRQSSETWEGAELKAKIPPHPFEADDLWLSSLGAWLDLHGTWDTRPYSEQQLQSIMVWDHVAPMGRDQYVRVVYPGYLYPFGHQAALVKVTERKMKTPHDTVASLYQRMFIVIGQRSRVYGDTTAEGRQFPFERIDLRPLATPPLDKPVAPNDLTRWIWPVVGGLPFRFLIDAWDREGRPIKLSAPLLWVNEAFNGTKAATSVQNEYAASTHREIAVHGQPVSFVRRGDDPDTDLQTESIFLTGRALMGDSVPRMSSAVVQVPAVQRLNPQGAMPIRYFAKYLQQGFGTDPGRVWAETLAETDAGAVTGEVIGTVTDPFTNATRAVHPDPKLPQTPTMGFGGSGGAPSDRTGGFVAPSLPLAALSRDGGPVGDPATVSMQKFNAADFLKGVDAKLFGIVNLVDLIPANLDLMEAAPAFVTETLGRIQAFITTIERLQDQIATEIRSQAHALHERATSAANQVQDQINDAQTAINLADQLKADAVALGQAALPLIKFPGSPLADLDETGVKAAMAPVQAKLDAVIDDLDQVAGYLPPQAKKLVESTRKALENIETFADNVDELIAFLKGFDPENLQLQMRFEWAPLLQDWPPGDDTLVYFKPDPTRNDEKRNLSLRVEGKVTATGEFKAEAIAEIRDIELRLFGAEPLIVFPIHHMFFKAGSAGKPEIDVVLGDLQFLNELSFIETIKDLIPFDGFSDPPFVEVDLEGARAGFTLELPNLAIGVFNLSNISLGADVSVPFIGKTVTAGFDFCTREKPFSLTVMCLGGGGWFGVRVSPEGLEILELGLEAQACLAVDFGVASGSISASVGVYLRLENDTGSLTGYFRLRGEVDVMGLISASIELYMSLTYQTDTGKMIGRAEITVEVDVLCFSGSVKITAERQLAGSNGDPSFREILGAEDGTSPHWTTYCDAFAGE